MRNRVSIAATLVLALTLGGCETSDMIDKITDLDIFGFSKPKPLQGERKQVFPEGVPGVAQGVPPELVKGYQPPPAPEPAPAPPPKQAKPKPKPKKKPVQQVQPAPAAPQPQQAQPWPAPPPPQQAAPWPAPPRQQAAPWPAIPGSQPTGPTQ